MWRVHGYLPVCWGRYSPSVFPGGSQTHRACHLELCLLWVPGSLLWKQRTRFASHCLIISKPTLLSYVSPEKSPQWLLSENFPFSAGICPASLPSPSPQRSLLCLQARPIVCLPHQLHLPSPNQGHFSQQVYTFPSTEIFLLTPISMKTDLKDASFNFIFSASFHLTSLFPVVPRAGSALSLQLDFSSPKPTVLSFVPSTPPKLPTELSNELHAVCPKVKCWSSLPFMISSIDLAGHPLPSSSSSLII